MEKSTLFATEGYIAYSINQMYLKLTCTIPPLRQEQPPEIVNQADIFFSPEHFKSLYNVMGGIIAEYEGKYGTICVEKK